MTELKKYGEMSARAKSALHTLSREHEFDVENPINVLKLPYSSLLKLKNCGRKTCDEIILVSEKYLRNYLMTDGSSFSEDEYLDTEFLLWSRKFNFFPISQVNPAKIAFKHGYKIGKKHKND